MSIPAAARSTFTMLGALMALAFMVAALAMPGTALAIEGECEVSDPYCEVAPEVPVCSDGFTWNAVAEACVQDVVDACPDANNPGVQGVGATCHVPEPEQADLQVGAIADPGVNLEHDVPLGSMSAQPREDAVRATELAVAGIATAPAANVLDAAGGGDGAPSGELPFTGASVDTMLLLAFAALLSGTFAFADARRAVISGRRA